MKLKKGSIESTLLFVLTPFLSIPVLFYNLKNRRSFSLVLLSLLIGFISYLYIPSFTNDKTRYIERLDLLTSYNLGEYISYLMKSNRPDFVFESLLYLFARLDWNIHYLFFAVTSFVVYSVFYLIRRIIWGENVGLNILYTILILSSFSLQGLFSGIRFIFGISLFLWGIYFYIFQKKSSGLLFILIACLTHFSTIYFVPALLLTRYKHLLNLNFYYLYLGSLFFLLLPPSFFISILGNVSVSEGYSSKIDTYTGDSDFVSNNLQRGFANQLIYYTRIAWVYFAYIYLAINKRYNRNSLVSQLLFISIFFINLTFAIPTIFSRYLNFIKILFVLFLLFESYTNPKFKKREFWLFFCLFTLSFIIDIYLMRYNFQASLLNRNLLTIINVLSNQFTLKDVLHVQ